MLDDKVSLPLTFLPKGLGAFVPSCCPVCGVWPAYGVCQSCYALFKQTKLRCHVCAIELASAKMDVCGYCLKTHFAFDEAIAAVSYVSPWRELVQKFKFYQATDYASLMAQLLYLMLNAHQKKAGFDDVSSVDLILPIPVTQQRIYVRGYNQSWVLAKHLSRLTGISAHPYALQHGGQVNQTSLSQTHRTRKERFRALKDAFFIPEKYIGIVQGQHIALVDDVMTTGATLHHAALSLKKAGAKKVSVWVFARTPEERTKN